MMVRSDPKGASADVILEGLFFRMKINYKIYRQIFTELFLKAELDSGESRNPVLKPVNPDR